MKKKKENMAAPKGNQSAKKLKTPELKKDAYEQYCAWIATGSSKKSWKFKHPKMSLTSKTMEKYIQENEIDFPPIHKEMAEADSLRIWEERGLAMMLGQIEKCQPAIFQIFMRNKKYNKRSKGKAGRGCIPNRVDIDERPKEVEEKIRLGDWELDTIIGMAQSGAIVSMVERRSKLTRLAIVSRKTAAAVEESLLERLEPIKDFVLAKDRAFEGLFVQRI